MLPAIATDQLTKNFDDILALDRLDLRVEQGEIFGFLGPNGAGKSTTIRLLLDLIRPTSGGAEVLGHDCQRESLAARALVGYLPGDLRVYPGLTGQEAVTLFARLRGGESDASYIETVAERLGLDLSLRSGNLSKGNRQKLGLLLALLGRPPVLLLDEPTSGLDPIIQHQVWSILREEAARGTTVFFSSHVMSEVEQVCERVGILRQGRLIAVDEIAGLKTRQLRHVQVRFGGAAPAPAEFALPGVRELRRENSLIEFEVTGEVDALIKQLARHHVVDIAGEQPTLDEILLSYYREEAPA
jgi:ABC-2 type transport system ATP-binding protein